MSPALVGIDLQAVFADPASAWAAPRYPDAVAGVRRLLPAFAGRIVLTRFVAPARPQGAWVPYYEQWPDQLRPEDDPIWDLTDGLGAIDAPVVTATTFGKWGEPLRRALGDADAIVLTGVSTDCCVLSTALAAADAGMPVAVVADACAGASDEDHRRALDAMALYAPLITVTTVEQVLRARSTGAERG
ncbi:cysteine hydrolase [Amnibacterium sp. CER49]|uniref:cysteine hydrolase family protein n=1 Tax=Amnibacterium sp. CER49 TaxID=3039161 RepID=UPI00244899F5|nr:cysteine hydrolase [Amnibacterium sp. CER49]MDH2443970.1 cysteine hydrolase [Amnibacterium sp. CER49]